MYMCFAGDEAQTGMSHRVKSFAIAREHFCIIGHFDIVLKYNDRSMPDDDDDDFHRYSSLHRIQSYILFI